MGAPLLVSSAALGQMMATTKTDLRIGPDAVWEMLDLTMVPVTVLPEAETPRGIPTALTTTALTAVAEAFLTVPSGIGTWTWLRRR